MSWTTVIWSIIAGICLGMAGLYLFVWFRSRRVWVSFFFSLSSTGVAAMAILELATMQAQTAAESGFEKGAVEATWSFPLWSYKYLKGYVQGFTGCGQSLIDYDYYQSTIGIGFALTDWL